jgi:alkylglycerol monooxygenase
MPEFVLSPNILVVPILISLVIVELIISKAMGRSVYNFQDSVTSINIGIMSQFVNATGAVISAFMYAVVEMKYGTFEWDMANPLTWIFALLLYDFLYYWVHRTGHEVNMFWASHITHHSSDEFNLSTALRQASTGFYFKWIFYMPLAVLGIPVQVFVVVGLIDLLYQVWVHTRLVGRLGWIEYVLVTPSNHRVHHGKNDYCIDKNYGGVFCVWDRIF